MQLMSTVTLLITLIIASECLPAQLNSCKQVFQLKKTDTSIIIELIPSYKDADLLKSKSMELLKMLDDYFILPEQVYFFNHYKGPVYMDGVIAARIPFTETFSIGKIKKTSSDSIPIHLHELTHQIFETTINNIYKNHPEVIWAFTSRVDMKGEGPSIEFINNTKHLTRFKNISSKQINDYFFKIRNTAEGYNELFADSVPVFLTGNPDAIFKNIYFKQVAEQGSDVEVLLMKNRRLRKFENDIIPFSSTRDDHSVFYETRIWIWKNIYQDYYLLKHPNMPKGELLFKIFEAIIISLKSVTKNFSESGNNLNYVELNDNLIQTLKSEFKLN